MVTQSTVVSTTGSIHSANAVVFRGDGEPKTPESMVARLSEIVGRSGIDADTYSNGGVVGELELRLAGLLGKEDAVFMPTGTLANHLAIRLLCAGRPRAIVQEQSHLYHDTGDCVQQLSGIHLVPLALGRPHFTLDEVKEAVHSSESGRVHTPIGALMIESPVRRQHGQVMPFDQMASITEFCSGSGISTHLDGARLFMMSAATGISPADYSALFDTVYVSLYKYLGAPFGAVIAGTSDFCEGLFHHRRMFGGGLSSASLAAALALDGLDGFELKFADAMNKARSLFEDLNRIPDLSVETYEHGSNIFPLRLPAEAETDKFVDALSDLNVFVSTDEDDDSSIHLTVNTTVLRQSNARIVSAFEKALNRG